MPSFKTYKKYRKWRHAFDRCFTLSTRYLFSGSKRRVSCSKFVSVRRNLTVWLTRQFHYVEFLFYSVCYYYDKCDHTVTFKYYD